MKPNETYYIKRLQNDLKIIWDDPQIENRTKWQLLDNALTQLTLIDEPELLSSIQEYFTEKDKLQKELEKHTKEQHRLMEQYQTNMQETYEELMKL